MGSEAGRGRSFKEAESPTADFKTTVECRRRGMASVNMERKRCQTRHRKTSFK